MSNKFYKLPEQNIYIPNKLYEVMKQIIEDEQIFIEEEIKQKIRKEKRIMEY
jgi:hypothetical protein